MDLQAISHVISKILNVTLFELNQTPVTMFSILMFIIMMIMFFILSRIINRMLLERVFARLQLETNTRFMMLRITHYSVMVVGTIVAFQFVGINLGGLAVIFGLLSVGIGFGLQNVTSNFVAGLILLFEQPIKIGDRVTVGDTEGDVIAINFRSTTIRSLNNITIIVPNSEFVSSNVINWTHGDPKIRLVIEVGVSYGSDLDAVLNSLEEVAGGHPDVLKNPKPDVLLSSFGDSSWNMLLRVWILDTKRHHIIRSDINCAIVRKFRENSIEIPFPQRDLHLRSAEPLPIKELRRDSGN
ncbi:MAG: mechanosensitive ion channel family protein [Calditrichaceae bacterium]